MKPTPILFIDLDGTVRKGIKELGGFVNGPSDVELFDGVYEILRSYKERGWKIVAISNQGGIALGHVTDSDVARAMQETSRLCGNLFDGMLWCPHHPNAIKDDPANDCICRKPNIANVVRAFTTLANQGIYSYPSACLFVGDMEDDERCASNAHIPFMWANDWRQQGPLV